MPPEWSPQEAVWLSWPVDDPRHWGGAKRDFIWQKFAEIAAAVSRHEIVRINAPGADHDAVGRGLQPQIAAEMQRSGGAQAGRAGNWRVFGITGIQRRAQGISDMGWRGESGLTTRTRDDIPAFSAQRGGAVGHRGGLRGRNPG